MARPRILEAATHLSSLLSDLCFLHIASMGPQGPVGNHVAMKVFGKLQSQMSARTERSAFKRLKEEKS